MKRLLLFSLFLMMGMLATAQWTQVAAPYFSAGTAVTPSLAVSPDGVPYVAFQDGANGSRVTVMKLNGTAWEAVGTAGFSAGSVQYTSLAFSPDGIPYVAYQDAANSFKATVMKLNGTAWEAVGAPGFSVGPANFAFLAFSPDGVPYVAYGGGKATVMRFNRTAWETVGTANFSAGQADFTSLAFSTEGVPYLAYTDWPNSGKVTVMKFNGTTWGTVGPAGFSQGQVITLSLAFSPDGAPYVAYSDGGNGSKATVMKWSGTTWVNVGTAGLSAGQAFYLSLAFSPDGFPYVAYEDAVNGAKATVMKFNNTAWVNVGSVGFSTGQAVYLSLAFSPDGIPYVAYENGFGGKGSVMAYNSIVTASRDGAYCPGAPVQVDYTAKGYYRGDNGFTAQLSNADGSFANPVSIGTLTSTGSGAIQATIPANTAPGSHYRIRVVASSPAGTGSDNGTNLTVNQLNTYYEDQDKDGFGNAAVTKQDCSQPDGYITDNTDCNDNDRVIHAITWVKDNDGDGFYTGAAVAACNSPGAEYVIKNNQQGGDCDDNSSDINPNTVWVKDHDGDGFYIGDPVTQCTSPGSGYVLKNNQQAGDCDDNSSDINPNTVWVKDHDGDGFYIGDPVTQCSSPGSGYVLKNNQQAGDCDDNDSDINPNTAWVKDGDRDGFYSGAAITQCSSPGAGYVIKTNQQAGDCNDNDPGIHSPITYYRDTDGDGFGTSVSAQFCLSTPPTDYSAKTGDFNDNDPAISPAAVEVCGNKVDDDCDGVVDENNCYPCQTGTGLTTTNIASNSAQLNWNATANPQQWQVEYKTIASGSKWVDVVLTGNLRSANIASLKANQTYNWHIRAKCNGKWTDYSVSATFKTTGSVSSSIVSSAVVTNNSTFGLYPNPTRGQFVIELNIGEKVNTNAKIQLTDLTGRTVHTENAAINYGTLKKTMNISSALAKGIYVVRIMANGRVYTAKLAYEK